MPRFMISALVIFVILVLGFILLALRGCESPPEPLQEHVEYPNTHEETTDVRAPVVQYPSVELPETGGIELW